MMDKFLIKNYNLNILSLSTSFQFGRKENSGTLMFVGRSLVFFVLFFLSLHKFPCGGRVLTLTQGENRLVGEQKLGPLRWA